MEAVGDGVKTWYGFENGSPSIGNSLPFVITVFANVVANDSTYGNSEALKTCIEAYWPVPPWEKP